MNRADQEETGISSETPVREKGDSDTYWNTRVLTHSILGKHYRTPQYNLNLLKDYLNSQLPHSSKIEDAKFRAPGEENLRFHLKTGVVLFNAHEPVSKDDFFRIFKVK